MRLSLMGRVARKTREVKEAKNSKNHDFYPLNGKGSGAANAISRADRSPIADRCARRTLSRRVHAAGGGRRRRVSESDLQRSVRGRACVSAAAEGSGGDERAPSRREVID